MGVMPEAGVPAGGDSAPLTDDALLGGRLNLLQPKEGHRFGLDAVMLAAAVPAAQGDYVLEAGCGVGAAMFCLLARAPGTKADGLEIDPALAAIAQENARRNGFTDRAEIHCGRIEDPPYRMSDGAYDHIFFNPPFIAGDAYSPSPHAGRVAAHREGGAGLSAWIRFGARMARPGGTITFIQRADRLDDILAALKGRVGDVVVFPLWPRADEAASRVIVSGRKGSAGPVSLSPGLVLHDREGRYTKAAEDVLRRAGALDLG